MVLKNVFLEATCLVGSDRWLCGGAVFPVASTKQYSVAEKHFCSSEDETKICFGWFTCVFLSMILSALKNHYRFGLTQIFLSLTVFIKNSINICPSKKDYYENMFHCGTTNHKY